MADTPNYNEISVSGTEWQRCYGVAIYNQYNELPYMILQEEKIITTNDGKQIKTPCRTLRIEFDPNNLNHQQIYSLINTEYEIARELADNPPEIIVPDNPPQEI